MSEENDLRSNIVNSIAPDATSSTSKTTRSNSPMLPVTDKQKYAINMKNVSANFSTLNSKIATLTKSNQATRDMLAENKKFLTSAMSSLEKAANNVRKNEFADLESRLERSDVVRIVDSRIASILGGSDMPNVNPAAFVGGLLGGSSVAIGKFLFSSVMKSGGLLRLGGGTLLMAQIPNAIENPNSNSFTEFGDMLDSLKKMFDPSYNGHEARDIVRVFTNAASKYSKEIDAKKKKERDEQAVKAQIERDRQMERELLTINRMMKRPEFFLNNDGSEAYELLLQKNGERLAQVRRDYFDGKATMADIDRVQAENQSRLDIFFSNVYKMYPSGQTRKGGKLHPKYNPLLDQKKDMSKSHLDIPDELKIPGVQYPNTELKTPEELKLKKPKGPFDELKIPDDMKIDKTSSISGERIRVASLDPGYEFLKSNDPDQRLQEIVDTGSNVAAEEYARSFSEFKITSDTFNIKTRMMSFVTSGEFSLESLSDVSLKSKTSVVIEAPDIVLRGRLRYEGLTQQSYAGSAVRGPSAPSSGGFVAPGSSFGGGFNSWFGAQQSSSSGMRSTSSTNVAVGDRARWALNYLKSQGWTDAQAAGIVGNLMAESGQSLNPFAVGDGGAAFGIAQWHSDRQGQFRSVFGKDIKDASFEEQMAFVDWELKNSEKSAGDKLRATDDPAMAAAIIDQYYERSSGAHRQKRMNYATGVFGEANTIDSKSLSSGSLTDQQLTKNFAEVAGSTGASVMDPISIAKKYEGLDERNPEDAKKLQQLFKDNAGIKLDPATAAWCAAFMNGVLGEAGAGGTGRVNARSFLDYGTPVDNPQVGDVVVFDRGGGWKGHVGLITGIEERDGKTYLKVLGGNQSTSESDGRGVTVNVKEFSTDSVLGYRRPPQATKAKELNTAVENNKKPVEKAGTGNDLLNKSTPSAPNETPPVVVNNTTVKDSGRVEVATNTHDNLKMSSFDMLDVMDNIA